IVGSVVLPSASSACWIATALRSRHVLSASALRFHAGPSPPTRGSLRRLLATLMLAAVGIGLAGAGRLTRAPEPTARALMELTSSGNVARRIITSRASLSDDDREAVRRALRMRESGTYISEILR